MFTVALNQYINIKYSIVLLKQSLKFGLSVGRQYVVWINLYSVGLVHGSQSVLLHNMIFRSRDINKFCSVLHLAEVFMLVNGLRL